VLRRLDVGRRVRSGGGGMGRRYDFYRMLMDEWRRSAYPMTGRCRVLDAANNGGSSSSKWASGDSIQCRELNQEQNAFKGRRVTSEQKQIQIGIQMPKQRNLRRNDRDDAELRRAVRRGRCFSGPEEMELERTGTSCETPHRSGERVTHTVTAHTCAVHYCGTGSTSLAAPSTPVGH
jgi:hypothetical protein